MTNALILDFLSNKKTPEGVLEHVAGIEPASSAWKAGIIAIIRHVRCLPIKSEEKYRKVLLCVKYSFTVLV